MTRNDLTAEELDPQVREYNEALAMIIDLTDNGDPASLEWRGAMSRLEGTLKSL